MKQKNNQRNIRVLLCDYSTEHAKEALVEMLRDTKKETKWAKRAGSTYLKICYSQMAGNIAKFFTNKQLVASSRVSKIEKRQLSEVFLW
jgi:hypothetical protein